MGWFARRLTHSLIHSGRETNVFAGRFRLLNLRQTARRKREKKVDEWIQHTRGGTHSDDDDDDEAQEALLNRRQYLSMQSNG